MKLFWILLFVVTIKVCHSGTPNSKIASFHCNSSGIIGHARTCRLRSKSRYLQTIELRLEFVKKFKNIRFTFIKHIKSGPYWRQLIKLENLDLCSLFKGVNALPAAKEFVRKLKEDLPTLPYSCPVLPGQYGGIMEYKIEDVGKMTPEEYEKWRKNKPAEADDFVTSTLLPNGRYRDYIRVFNNEDPEGISVYYQFDKYLRLNDEVF